MYQIIVIFQFLFAFTTVYFQWRGSSMSSPQVMFGNNDRSVSNVNSFGDKNLYNFKQNLNWNSPTNEQPNNLADQYIYSKNEKNVFSGLSNLKPDTNISPHAKWNPYAKNNEDRISSNSGKKGNYKANSVGITNSGYFGQNSTPQTWQLGEKEKKVASSVISPFSSNSIANFNSIKSFYNNNEKYFPQNENSEKSPANNQNANIFITPSNNLIVENTDENNYKWNGNKNTDSKKNSIWIKSQSNSENMKYQSWLNNKKTKTISSKKPESNTWKKLSTIQEPFDYENLEIDKSSNKQKYRASAMKDLSILDELDKNDWYLASEQDFPEIDSYSNINIDVSELWYPDKMKGLNVKRKRKNREFKVNCKCIDINLCNEEGMIVSKEHIGANKWRLIDQPKCKRLTEVCCSHPKSEYTSFQNKPYFLECGQRTVAENLTEKTEDNNISIDGEVPWALSFENLKDGSRCGASLVHPQLALTVAHCVTGARSEDLIIYTALSSDESFQKRSVSKIIIHPGFSEENPRNDIALLLIETPFKLTDNVNAICLPVTNDKWFSNRCFVVGWNLRGGTTKMLQKEMVSFLPQNECQNILLNTYLWHEYVLHSSFVCAAEDNSKTLCLGDEGSAVICPSKKFRNTYLQIGIVSKSLNCNELGQPGIFTNVLKFLDWINKYMFEMEISDAIKATRVYWP